MVLFDCSKTRSDTIIRVDNDRLRNMVVIINRVVVVNTNRGIATNRRSSRNNGDWRPMYVHPKLG